jgi:S1-C subfamily serine protease
MQRSSSRARAIVAVVAAIAAMSTLAPAGAAAQDDDSGPVRGFAFGRPRLGVKVGIKADKEKDRIGARIEEVTSDGPADKAGLKEGDIITRFNGVALGGVKSDDEDESGPGQKLISLARKLDDGDTVEVEYRRGSDTRKAKIVAQELGGMATQGWRMRVPDMRGMVLPRMELPFSRGFEGGPGEFRFFSDRLEGGLELTDLNPDLGEYFGAKEGVLVLRTPADSTIPLKAGDVILAIDGRSPKSEGQAHRILRSYEAGEVAKIDVLRKQKKLTLSWKPNQGEERWKTPRPGRAPGVERS